ncbi:MAG: ATP-binding protein [Bacteroidales bacterium]|jgi:signal transduction histidine kinase|nr:ATP-binding protein [Bacteroidales bacterium]MCK9448537.1 ATP-binding protein [Bacteroidales bacterium]MDD3700012.1 ATP-binding protein [Bacteroidales bacterium]MDY0368784.1 ATP-binding protein [Bacteroidales bacterium]
MATLHILVVDDEPGIRAGINRILHNYIVSYPFMDEDIDFNLIDAATGEEAIDILNTAPIDIVLLDNKLPGMDGIEVLEYINQQQFDLAVMMITSYASLDLALDATKSGAYNFMPKPFTSQELRSNIDNVSKHLFLKRMTRKMQAEGKQIRFQFLSVLSHELKSPINAIEGYLKMMQERQMGDLINDYDRMIDRSLARLNGMRNLIMDLLDLTKMESGKKERKLREINLQTIAQTAMDTMEPYSIQKNVTMKLHTDGNTYLLADADEMEIIFNNLVSNAVKYNKENGLVDIYLKDKNNSLEITISDTGIGMSQQDVELIFKDFVRIKNSKTKAITGSGLGLSITKKMIDQYNGTIDVQSQLDVGTSFVVSLPRH